jgi:DNA-binding GntR family transcriptional regulator
MRPSEGEEASHGSLPPGFVDRDPSGDLLSRTTLADTIVYALTEEIVAKRLPPDAPLDEARLGERFGASRTPVREALRQLAASGLVVLRAHSTPRVAPLDHDRIHDLFDVMAELEALCAMRAATAMSAVQRAELESLHETLGGSMRAGDQAGYRAGNVAFHQLIYAGSRNAYLQELALGTRSRLAPYRGAQLESSARIAASHAEHGAIVSAIVRGESVQAGALMRQHLLATRDALLKLGHGLMPRL